jgi:FMN phosphatase YigB (HAD superfamily)
MTEHTSRHARRIAAVTFDCWGTLIEVRDGTAAAHRRIDVLAARAGIDRERATVFIEQGRAEHFAEWLAGRHYGAAGIARFCMEKVGVSDETEIRSFRQELEQASLANEFVLLHGAEQTLAVLKASGIRTAVVCDTGLTPGWVTRKVLTDLGVERDIDAFAFSDDVGMPKPHARIFEAALDTLGVKPSATVHPVTCFARTSRALARSAWQPCGSPP